MYDHELIDRLHFVVNKFCPAHYTEESIFGKSGKMNILSIGENLPAEHERYLVETFCYSDQLPHGIKSFYMKQNDDGKTVRAMDVLFPKIGEIIGGSEREADYDKLMNRVNELEMSIESIWWYLESRKFGTAPHSGFGLGFERLMLFVTGMTNIRDVIPFPRTPKNAEF